MNGSSEVVIKASWVQSPEDHAVALVVGDLWLGYVMLGYPDSPQCFGCTGSGTNAPVVCSGTLAECKAHLEKLYSAEVVS